MPYKALSLLFPVTFNMQVFYMSFRCCQQRKKTTSSRNKKRICHWPGGGFVLVEAADTTGSLDSNGHQGFPGLQMTTLTPWLLGLQRTSRAPWTPTHKTGSLDSNWHHGLPGLQLTVEPRPDLLCQMFADSVTSKKPNFPISGCLLPNLCSLLILLLLNSSLLFHVTTSRQLLKYISLTWSWSRHSLSTRYGCCYGQWPRKMLIQGTTLSFKHWCLVFDIITTSSWLYTIHACTLFVSSTLTVSLSCVFQS